MALIRSNKQCLPEIVADMIDVAASIHFADRLIDKSSDTICEINVTLPLRDLYSFSDANIREGLEDVLYWYTGDHWRFHFVKRVSEKRAAETQIHFPFNESNRAPIEMALWSGGLDSMAGLYNRLKAYPDTHFILVGTGSNVYTHAIQRDVAHEIGRVFSERTTLVQIPIRFEHTQDLPKNRRPRARGLVFLLIGAACAYLEKVDVLHVYENGIGAINLPFRASEIGLDHSRSVHPISLYKIGKWLSQLFNKSFEIHNPFLYSTKAQICAALAGSEHADLIFRTHSCDQLRHEHPRQCGHCSSCLLRRYALTANGIRDLTHYAYPDIDQEENHRSRMLAQTRTLHTALNSPSPWQQLLEIYHSLRETAEAQALAEKVDTSIVIGDIIGLYRNYIREWESVATEIEKEDVSFAASAPQPTKSDLQERMIPLWN